MEHPSRYISHCSLMFNSTYNIHTYLTYIAKIHRTVTLSAPGPTETSRESSTIHTHTSLRGYSCYTLGKSRVQLPLHPQQLQWGHHRPYSHSFVGFFVIPALRYP